MSRIAIPVLSHTCPYYIASLTALGAVPVLMTAPESMEEFDGLLLPGGLGDIAPERYGQENSAAVAVYREEDEIQLRFLDAFVRAGKPVLGICRGMQLINVYFGGTLNQNIDSLNIHNGEKKAIDRVHGSYACSGCWLERLYGEQFPVNSYHHQAVDRPGEGIEIIQIAEDGIPEGMIHKHLPVYAVQWHPERCCFARAREDAVDGSLVYRYFLREIREAAAGL